MSNKQLPLFLSISEYRSKFLSNNIDNLNLINYFDQLTLNNSGYNHCMIKFCENDYVFGGSWPENYALFTVIDYARVKSKKGKKKIIINESEYKIIYV